MNKNDLMLKAVIQLGGEMARNCNGLIYATSKNPSFPEGTISHWDTDSKSDFLGFMNGCVTWEWLCTRDEFYQFIDELIEDCIKWDKPKWNGEGFPPVGVECEYKYKDYEKEFKRGVIKFAGDKLLVMDSGWEQCYHIDSLEFRPIKTEAEKERDELVRVLCGGHEEISLSDLVLCGWGEIADRVIEAGWKCDKSQNGE